MIGVVAGVGYYVLDKTLGETLSDAWLNSSLHAKLKRFFLSNVRIKPYDILDYIGRIRQSNRYMVNHELQREDDGSFTIVVRVKVNRDREVPPPRRELPRQDS